MSGLRSRLEFWGVREWGLAAAALAAIVYLPSLGNGFAYDDLPIIVRDQTLHSFGGIGELLIRPYWPGEDGAYFGLWRPVTSVTMALLWIVGGGSALAYHLANVALHAAVTGMVVVTGARLFPVRVAALAGMVFAVHPVHVEAVANGVGISELLAALFTLLAVERFTRTESSRHDRGDRTLLRDVGFLYLLAFLSKESAVVLPGILFLVDGVRERTRASDLGRYLRDRGALYAVLVVVAGTVLAARGGILGGVADPVPALGAQLLPDIPKIHTVGEIWAQQLRLITVPTWLSPDYAPSVVRITTGWTRTGLLALAAVLSLLVGAAIWFRTRRSTVDRALPAGIVWYVTAVSPITNLVFVAGVLVAERTLYLPSIGAAWVIAAILASIADRARPVAWGMGVLLFALWIPVNLGHQPEWADQTTIFGHMVEVVPESGRSAWVRGDLRMEAEDYESASLEYRTALGQLGDEYVFLSESARRLVSAGRVEAAVPFLDRAWAHRPERFEAPQLRTVLESRREAWPEVIRWANRAIEIRPEDRASRHLLSVALAAQGRWAEAARAREALIAVGETGAWQQWFWLIELRGRAGEPEGARVAADSARIRAPTEAAIRQIDSVLAAVGAAGEVSQNSGILRNTTANEREPLRISR